MHTPIHQISAIGLQKCIYWTLNFLYDGMLMMINILVSFWIEKMTFIFLERLSTIK